MPLLEISGMLDPILDKYGVPRWTKSYIIAYARKNPTLLIKHGLSFIDIKRKKGSITKEQVYLPNGIKFDMDFVNEILAQFYYGEQRLSEIYKNWANDPAHPEHEYREGFMHLSMLAKKHMRAIKNIMDGLSFKSIGPNEGAKEMFDFISNVHEKNERIITSGLLLKYMYSRTFGIIFYRVFYPTAPEFMRSFGKVFIKDTKATSWLKEKTNALLSTGDKEEILEFTRFAIGKMISCINTEVPNAKKSNIENEFLLLRDISIAYPLHMLNESGFNIDPDQETAKILKNL